MGDIWGAAPLFGPRSSSRTAIPSCSCPPVPCPYLGLMTSPSYSDLCQCARWWRHIYSWVLLELPNRGLEPHEPEPEHTTPQRAASPQLTFRGRRAVPRRARPTTATTRTNRVGSCQETQNTKGPISLTHLFLTRSYARQMHGFAGRRASG